MKVQVNKLSKRAKGGFSLVELLVVIAVIGIMAAIAIPMISNINANATTAKNKRNAQNIASVYGAAAAAGAAISTNTLGTAINSLQAGIPGSGQFATTTFKVQLSDTEEAAAIAATSMTLSDGVLSFTP
jgi:type IV pilus assembly protein PilA